METVLERPGTDAALSEWPAPPSQGLPASLGGAPGQAAAASAAVTDFSACYARELSSLVWFVMSLGADAHRAADVAANTVSGRFAESEMYHPAGSPSLVL